MLDSRRGAAGEVGGYADIHGNLRYWMGVLVSTLAHDTGPLTIYDIGSNDCELTLPHAIAGHRVYAFEPGRDARSRLVRRAAAGGVAAAEFDDDTTEARLVIVPLALGRSAESRSFTVYNDDTFSSLFERSDEERVRYGLVPVERRSVTVEALDSLVSVRRIPPPDIVKIDVEGAEREVLLGAIETLRAVQPPMIVEYSCINATNAGYARDELIRLLADFGYPAIYGLWRNDDRRLHTGDTLSDCRIWNLLALPDRVACRSRITDHILDG